MRVTPSPCVGRTTRPTPVRFGAGQIGGGRIGVAVSLDRSAEQVWIAITDDGIGLPPELAERIFDPFFTTKDASKGVGLGLSICASLIGAMGERIVAESLEQGARFTISLPIRRNSFRETSQETHDA